MRFTWSARKAVVNRRKHDVWFEEAATVFGDPLSLTIADPAHSSGTDERYVTIGLSIAGKLLVVVHSDREDSIRIISARRATPGEREDYEGH